MVPAKNSWLCLALATVAVFCARGVKAVSLDISGIVFIDDNANGRVDAGERILPEVVISDGVKVIESDQYGRYRLTTESSRVLFVSLPGDYCSVGDFYESLRNHRNGDIIDFPLIEHLFRDDVSFLFFTDSHLTPEEKFNAVNGLKAALAHMNGQDVDLVLSGGDLIMDALRACEPAAREQYELYRELSSQLDVPLFNAIGNHELFGVYLEGVDDDPCVVEEDDPLYGVGLYREYLGPDYYSFNWGPYHFMFLNTIGLTKVRTDEGDTVRVYYGTVGPDQIAWMKKDLATLSGETPIILVGHIPFMTAVHTFEGYGDYQTVNYRMGDPQAKSYTHVVSNAAEVINEVLADHRLILALAGHHHHHEVVQWADNEHHATFVLGGSVCGQWWQGDRRIAGSTWPEGYLKVRLKRMQVEDLQYISFDWKGYKE